MNSDAYLDNDVSKPVQTSFENRQGCHLSERNNLRIYAPREHATAAEYIIYFISDSIMGKRGQSCRAQWYQESDWLAPNLWIPCVHSISQPDTAGDAPTSFLFFTYILVSKCVLASAALGDNLIPQSTFHYSSRTNFLNWHDDAHTKHEFFFLNHSST